MEKKTIRNNTYSNACEQLYSCGSKLNKYLVALGKYTMVRQKNRASLNISLLLSLFLNCPLVSANEVRCSLGFGSGVEKILLPSNFINDNYCDCPIDGGIDEPNTSACSGVIDGGWSGIKASRDNRYFIFSCFQSF